MADSNAITIPIDLPRDKACAFAELLKRTSYDDCLRRSNRLKKYSDGRDEADVMWAGLTLPAPISPARNIGTANMVESNIAELRPGCAKDPTAAARSKRYRQKR